MTCAHGFEALGLEPGTPLTYVTFTPGPISLTSEGPPLRNVVEAMAVPGLTFRRGTSGALWDCDDGLVGLQVAGMAPHYRRGYAVALQTCLGQACVALGATRLHVVGDGV